MEWKLIDLRQTEPRLLRQWFADASLERQAQILAYRRTEDKLRSLCADHLAREMLAAATGLTPRDLIFERDAHGKPFAKNCALHFNLTHSGDFAACAIHDRPVGIDMEAIRPVRAALSEKVCADAELSWVMPDGAFDNERFLRLWTAKEAFLKCTGEGIASDLRKIAVIESGVFSRPPFRFFHQYNTKYALTVVCES